MIPQTNPQLTIENFGPIKSGSVELKPLTILIGPNNSGKSYVATLAYALLRTLAAQTRAAFPDSFLPRLYEGQQAFSPEIGQWLQTLPQPVEDAIPFRELPGAVQDVLLRDARGVERLLQEEIAYALTDYFGVQQLDSLRRAGANSDQGLGICLYGIAQDQPILKIREATNSGVVVAGLSEADLIGRSFHFNETGASRVLQEDDLRHKAVFVREMLLQELWIQLRSENGLPLIQPYYLPPARSGILHGYQALSAIPVTMVRRRIGREAISIPAYQGIVGDFLEELSRKIPTKGGRRGKRQTDPALEYLERRIFNGQISLEETGTGQPQITYASGATRLSIDRASSMIAELAPLALWIKDLIPGDCLFIDEPEAHLHPENQRRVATVLVRLVRAGVRVVVTTHSSTILHQISNHLIAASLSPTKRTQVGFTDDDLLRPEEVGVSLFDVQEDGTQIRLVTIDPEYGIDEEEFVRVSQALGNETYDLLTAAHGEIDLAPVHA